MNNQPNGADEPMTPHRTQHHSDHSISQALKRYKWREDNLLAATKDLDGHWIAALERGDTDTLMRADEPDSSAPKVTSEHIATDTRTIKAGDVFLALSGENFDGHDYIDAAAKKGAVAAIVSRPISASIPQLVVSDTRLALGHLAAYRRQQHPNIKIIAITGSSGKTTCKEMLGSIFGRLAPTLITRGNLNNDLGAPMTLLELSAEHRYAIVELGANHVGEIAYTTNLVQPDVACVLNVGTAHLGEFGSRDNICQAKAEIYQTLTNQQYAVVPDDDDYRDTLQRIAKRHTDNVIGFGQTTVSAKDIHLSAATSEFGLQIEGQCVEVSLPLAGEHNISNALAAAACAHALGVAIDDIVAGLSHTQPAKGRLHAQPYGSHCLIDDTYNANPHSVRAAAKVLAAQRGERIMVLGDIAELGNASAQEHHALGAAIAATGIDMLLCVGEYADQSVAGASTVAGDETTQAQAFTDKDGLLAYLRAHLEASESKPCTILLKGSRSAKMETLITALLEE